MNFYKYILTNTHRQVRGAWKGRGERRVRLTADKQRMANSMKPKQAANNR